MSIETWQKLFDSSKPPFSYLQSGMSIKVQAKCHAKCLPVIVIIIVDIIHKLNVCSQFSVFALKILNYGGCFKFYFGIHVSCNAKDQAEGNMAGWTISQA